MKELHAEVNTDLVAMVGEFKKDRATKEDEINAYIRQEVRRQKNKEVHQYKKQMKKKAIQTGAVLAAISMAVIGGKFAKKQYDGGTRLGQPVYEKMMENGLGFTDTSTGLSFNGMEYDEAIEKVASSAKEVYGDDIKKIEVATKVILGKDAAADVMNKMGIDEKISTAEELALKNEAYNEMVLEKEGAVK